MSQMTRMSQRRWRWVCSVRRFQWHSRVGANKALLVEQGSSIGKSKSGGVWGWAVGIEMWGVGHSGPWKTGEWTVRWRLHLGFIWNAKAETLACISFTLAFSDSVLWCPVWSSHLLKEGLRTALLKLLSETMKLCGVSAVSVYMWKPQHDAINPKESLPPASGKGNKISQRPGGSWPEQHRVDSLQASTVPFLETLTVC